MEISFFSRCLVLYFLICCNSQTFSQYFIAGQHIPGNYFVDINPDTTLTGTYVNYYDTTSPTIFPIDINGDGEKDIFLKGYGTWHNSDGFYGTTINCYDSIWQIAYGGIMGPCQNKTAKQFMENDTINDNIVWSKDKELILTFFYSVFFGGGCSYNGFDTSSGSYLGVRQLRPMDTIYGWIKIITPALRTFTIMEFASSLNCSAIDDYSRFINIYPIPTNSTFTIENNIQDFDLTLYDKLGVIIRKIKLHTGKTEINLIDHPSGLYILRLFQENMVITKKLIKQ